MRFGFMSPSNLHSTAKPDWVDFPDTLGRFELLHVHKNETSKAPFMKRIPIKACADPTKAFCWN